MRIERTQLALANAKAYRSRAEGSQFDDKVHATSGTSDSGNDNRRFHQPYNELAAVDGMMLLAVQHAANRADSATFDNGLTAHIVYGKVNASAKSHLPKGTFASIAA